MPIETAPIETKRLQLREFSRKDAGFILQLLNTPGWIRYIGDRQIKTEADARKFIQNYLIRAHQSSGLGFWRITLKDSNQSIGMCGLIKRDYLDNIDIGYAIMPEYYKKGYALEAAQAVLNYAKQELKLVRLLAVVDKNNAASIKLLTNLGMVFEKTVNNPQGQEIHCYSLEPIP